MQGDGWGVADMSLMFVWWEMRQTSDVNVQNVSQNESAQKLYKEEKRICSDLLFKPLYAN